MVRCDACPTIAQGGQLKSCSRCAGVTYWDLMHDGLIHSLRSPYLSIVPCRLYCSSQCQSVSVAGNPTQNHVANGCICATFISQIHGLVSGTCARRTDRIEPGAYHPLLALISEKRGMNRPTFGLILPKAFIQWSAINLPRRAPCSSPLRPQGKRTIGDESPMFADVDKRRWPKVPLPQVAS